MTIGERYKLIRETVGDKKMSQSAFGDALKVGRDVIANIEQGRTVPTDVLISFTCSKYGIDEHWLRTGDGEMYQSVEQSEKITRFLSSLVKPSEDAEKQEKIRNFISSVSQLSYDEWEVLYKIAKSWVDKNEQA